MAVQRRRTTPFGETRGTAPGWWAGDKGFLGATNDPSGLTHIGARLYDPDLGRFVSVDPIVDLSDPQQMHGYAYANNNPTTFSDPTGLIVTGDNEGLLTATKNSNGTYTIKDKRPPYSPPPPPPPAEDPALAAAKAARDAAKQMLVNAAKELLQIAMDELGITAALDCFFKGDMGSCLETALNVAMAFVGGLAGKLLARYGAPWEWAKGARLVQRIWNALERVVKGVKGWIENSKLVKRLEAALSKSDDCNSFVRGTPVLMAGGLTKHIEDVDVGDVVIATDPETGETAEKIVAGTIIGSGTKDLVEVTVDLDGNKGAATDVIVATHNHPFWTPDLGEWVEATDLRVGSWLQTSSGTWIQVAAVKRWTQTATVYNLTVTDIHTYYVLAGDAPVLVHNDAVQPYEVGTADDLKRRSVPGDGLDIHHLPQKHPAGQVIPGYDPKTGPAMAVPEGEHRQIPRQRGVYTGTGKDLVTKDLDDLATHTNAPPSAQQAMRDQIELQFPSQGLCDT
jgi:RHS repeat-associated protein